MNVLGISKVLGLQNVKQINGFRSAIKSGAKTAECNLVLTSKMGDSFVSMLREATGKSSQDCTLLDEIVAKCKKRYPKFFQEGTKRFMNIKTEKITPSAGTIRVNDVVKTSTGEVLSEASATIAQNKKGMLVKASSEGYGSSYKGDIFIARDANLEEYSQKAMAGLQDSIEGDVACLSLPQVKGDGFRASFDATYPVSFPEDKDTFKFLLDLIKDLVK